MQAHFGGQMQRYIVTEQVHQHACHFCDKKRDAEDIEANGNTQLVVKSNPRQQTFIVNCPKVLWNHAPKPFDALNVVQLYLAFF